MKNLLWVLSALSCVVAVVNWMLTTTPTITQQMAVGIQSLGIAIIPYCFARAVDKMNFSFTKPKAKVMAIVAVVIIAVLLVAWVVLHSQYPTLF
jgi:hypothetical protein